MDGFECGQEGEDVEEDFIREVVYVPMRAAEAFRVEDQNLIARLCHVFGDSPSTKGKSVISRPS